jgi:type 1 glutamine amidotransferase
MAGDGPAAGKVLRALIAGAVVVMVMTRALPKAFSVHEEFYVFSHDPLPRLHVLARLDGQVHHPLVWCRRAERGRVSYDALGHFAETWRNPLQIAMATGGIAWATGLESAPSCG